MRIQHQRTNDGRQYNTPTASEIAGIIVGDIDEEKYKCDVVVHDRKTGVRKISDLHPSFMTLTYPLIHPYGEDGYRVGIPLREGHSTGLKR